MNYVDPPEHAVEVMLDLETLGVKPYCPVLSIGAVRFEVGPMQPMEPFYQAIRLESCLDFGLKPCADTVRRWMQQSKEAQDAAFNDERAVDLPEALDRFTDWMGSRPDRVWGNSSLFDNGILQAAYFVCNKQLPWKLFSERCYRTLKGLPGMDRFKLQRTGTHHNALDDATTQARHARVMLQALAPAPAIGLQRVKPEGGLSAPVPLGTDPLTLQNDAAGEDAFRDIQF